MNTELEEARRAHALLQQARRRLLRPDFAALGGTASDLKLVADCLDSITGGSKRALAAEVAAKRRQLAAVEELALAGANFCHRWERLLASSDTAQQNYAADGQARPTAPTSAGVILRG